jgi:hypothetical protein
MVNLGLLQDTSISDLPFWLGDKKVIETQVYKLALLWLRHYSPMTSKQQCEKGHTRAVP